MVDDKKNNYSIWQLAGGSLTRSYYDVFLQHSVGLIGPGDSGPWHDYRTEAEFDGNFIRRFASEMKIGDAILLRVGLSTIKAIGIVASNYMYLDQFDDVNGLDLQHTRRIRWACLPESYTFDQYIFGANPPRLSKVWSNDISDYVEKFLNSPPTNWQTESLSELPQEEPELDEIPRNLKNIVSHALDLTPLYLNATIFGDLPTEDELVAHFVVPFLISLQWPPELIAVKWRYIDVAVFNELPAFPKTAHL